MFILRAIMIKLNITAIFALFLLSSCRAEEVVYAPLFDCSKRLIEPYGIVAHISRVGEKYEYDTIEKGLDTIQSIGISYIRADFDWATFRTSYNNDSLNFERFDKMMNSLSNRKMNFLAIITNTDNARYPAWLNHTNLLVKRYVNSVHYWEMINEADLAYTRIANYGSKDYMRLLKAGYNIVKQSDRQGKVLYTGLNAVSSRSFMEETFKLGASSFFDIMNVHFYTVHKEPEVLIDYYNELKRKLENYNIRKSVWMTETGYPTKGDDSVSPEVQALRLPRTFLISFACGVDKVFWYNSRASELNDYDRECHFGILHKDYSPKPAYYAYKTLVKMCPNKSTRPVLSKKDGLYQAKWKRNDGKIIIGIWTSTGNKSILVQSKNKYKCYNVLGKEVFLDDDRALASPTILYVVCDKDIKILLD